MPGTKTVLRLIVMVGVLAAYLGAPYYLDQGRKELRLGVSPRLVTAFTVTGFREGELTFERRQDGRWIAAGTRNAEADLAMVGYLLNGLATASCKVAASGSLPPSAPQLTIQRTDAEPLSIELGPRRVPLKRQLVRANGRLLEVNLDISACLGFWERAEPPSSAQLLKRTLVRIEGDRIARIELVNPLTGYAFEATDELVSVPNTEAAAPDTSTWPTTPEHEAHVPAAVPEIRVWRTTPERQANVPAAAPLSRFAAELSLLTVSRPASAQEIALSAIMPYHVRFVTVAGHTQGFAVSGEINADGEHLLRITEPEEGDTYVINVHSYGQLVPAGGYLFRKVPTIETNASQAVAVSYERDGHRCELSRKDDGDWQVTRPRVPYEVFTPPSVDGMPAVSTAVAYLSGLEHFRTRELFEVNSEARKKIVHSQLSRAVVQVMLTMPDHRRVEILLSPPVPGTEIAFLSVDGEVTVAEKHAATRLAPDVTAFFDPRETRGKMIEW